MPGLFWLAAARACSIGITPLLLGSERKLPFLKEPDVRRASASAAAAASGKKKIVINVSGRRFVIRRSELLTHPETLLGSEEIDYFYDDTCDEYFFERDPDLFRVILSYYRTGKLHFNRFECVSAFQDELAFFGISTESVGSCCYEDYKERAKDLEERLDEAKPQKTRGRGSVESAVALRERVWQAFENPQDSLMGMVFYYVTGFLITVSVTVNVTETVSCGRSAELDRDVTCGERYETAFHVLDSTCVLIFTAEYLVRLFGAPCRWNFFKSAMSLIDIAAILPFYLSLYIGEDSHFSGIFITLRVFRVFRIFKFSRHSAGLRILGRTLNACVSELGFLLFSLAMAIVIFGTILYYCEKGTPRTKFTSIPATFWYTIVTITTLGYGDMVPTSPIGKIVGAICSLSGVLVIALPVPVIVSNFSRIYHQSQRADKRKLQLTTRMRRKALSRIIASEEYADRCERYRHFWETDTAFAESGGSGNKDQLALQHYHLLSCLERVTDHKIISYKTYQSFSAERNRTNVARTTKKKKTSLLNGGDTMRSVRSRLRRSFYSRFFAPRTQAPFDEALVCSQVRTERRSKSALECEESTCLTVTNANTPSVNRFAPSPLSSRTVVTAVSCSNDAEPSGTGTGTGIEIALVQKNRAVLDHYADDDEEDEDAFQRRIRYN